MLCSEAPLTLKSAFILSPFTLGMWLQSRLLWLLSAISSLLEGSESTGVCPKRLGFKLYSSHTIYMTFVNSLHSPGWLGKIMLALPKHKCPILQGKNLTLTCYDSIKKWYLHPRPHGDGWGLKTEAPLSWTIILPFPCFPPEGWWKAPSFQRDIKWCEMIWVSHTPTKLFNSGFMGWEITSNFL